MLYENLVKIVCNRVIWAFWRCADCTFSSSILYLSCIKKHIFILIFTGFVGLAGLALLSLLSLLALFDKCSGVCSGFFLVQSRVGHGYALAFWNQVIRQ